MEQLPNITLRGVLKGHSGWVTAIVTPPEEENVIITGSRDKSIIIWDLTREDPANFGRPRKAFTGHSHYISDVVISSDGQFVLSGSWDGTLRLWDINAGTCHRQFVGHKKDVLSVAFSADNRQIVSGSRDKTIKLWNTLGVCKYTIEDNCHSEWVSCVRFTPNVAPVGEYGAKPLIVSAGWDKLVKVCQFQNYIFFLLVVIFEVNSVNQFLFLFLFFWFEQKKNLLNFSESFSFFLSLFPLSCVFFLGVEPPKLQVDC